VEEAVEIRSAEKMAEVKWKKQEIFKVADSQNRDSQLESKARN
jgi:hypothetical protein